MDQTFNLKLILTDSIQFFIENIRQIAGLCLPFLLAGSVFSNVVLTSANMEAAARPTFFYSVFVNLALHPIYTAALIMMMARRAMHQNPTTSELIASSLKKYMPFLLLTLIQMGLMWFGFMLLIIPGIWVAVRLAFADFFLVIDDLDPREAIFSSFKITRQYFFPVLTTLGLFALPVFLLGLLFNEILTATGANDLFRSLADTVLSFIALFLHVVLFRIFMQARQDSRNPTPVG